MGGLISAIVFKSGKDKLAKIPEDLFSISVKDIDGIERTIGDYAKGKSAMVFVNVASK